MADCDFVQLNGTWLPSVSGVTLTPVYVRDEERTISGMLRVDHTGLAREWTVELTSVPGNVAQSLVSALLGMTGPVSANIMGTGTVVVPTVERVTHVPRILRGRSLSASGDKNRVNIRLVLREVNAEPLWPDGWMLDLGTPGGVTTYLSLL